MTDISGSCSYECEPEGKCKVKESITYTKDGKKYKGTSTSSCFAHNFGGDCKGKLHACQPCRHVCDERSPGEAGQFEVLVEHIPAEEGKPKLTTRTQTEKDKEHNEDDDYGDDYTP